MDDPGYWTLLAKYAHRFGDTPPSILTKEGAVVLMTTALQRGTPISTTDINVCREGVASTSLGRPSSSLGWTSLRAL